MRQHICAAAGFAIAVSVSPPVCGAEPAAEAPRQGVQVSNNSGTTVVSNSAGRDFNVTVNNNWDIHRQAVLPANRSPSSPGSEGAASITSVDLLVGQLRRDPKFAGFLVQFLGATGQLNVQAATDQLKKDADGDSGLAAMFYAIVLWNGHWGTTDAAAARRYFILAADRGAPGAQALVAQRYWTGDDGFPLDKAKSSAYVSRLIDNEYASRETRALQAFLMSDRLIDGDGVPKNICAGVQMLGKAANMGYAAAMLSMGYERMQKPRCLPVSSREALTWFERAAALGEGTAAAEAGRLHQFGLAGARDYMKAENYYLQSSLPYADRQLAWLYAKGLVSSARQPDYSKALSYARRAADAGDGDAMVTVGLLYEYGLGVEQNAYESARWYGKAGSAGIWRGRVNQSVQVMNECVGIEDLPNWRDELEVIANNEAIDASTRGNALFHLGFAYLGGKAGTPKDEKRAAALFERSCKLGVDRGCTQAASLRPLGAAQGREAEGAKRHDAQGLKTAGTVCRPTVTAMSSDPDTFP